MADLIECDAPGCPNTISVVDSEKPDCDWEFSPPHPDDGLPVVACPDHVQPEVTGGCERCGDQGTIEVTTSGDRWWDIPCPDCGSKDEADR